MNVPIVFFIYKRPELTKLVFQQIVESQPNDIFVFADGPNNALEKEKCEETRSIIDQFDVKRIRVHKHYQAENIGLFKNIQNGLNLVFSQFEHAIILEDDCIPHKLFFSFCIKNLKRYDNNKKVMQISGTSLLNDNQVDFRSIKSRYSLPNWGWATWKSSWEKFNPEFTTFKANKDFLINNLINNDSSSIIKAFNSLSYGNRNSWDVQWMADLWVNGGLTILPSINLVINLGNGDDSSYMPESSQFSVPIPNQIREFDSFTQLDASIEEESRIEKSVVRLIDGFINSNKDKYSLTKQIISQIEPREYKESYNTLDELKEDIIPLPKFTLLPTSTFHLILEYFTKTNPIFNDNWVQIGCWKGGSSLFLASMRREANASGNLYIIDTFGDIPITQLKWKKDLEFIEKFNIKSPILNYKAEVEELLNKYDLLQKCILIKSSIEKLKLKTLPFRVTFVFIDVDFYEPTFLSLEKVYNLIIKEGVLLIDDYYSPFFNCKDAVDDFFNLKKKKREVSYKKFSNNILMIQKHV